MSPVQCYGDCCPTQTHIDMWGELRSNYTYSNHGYTTKKVETKKERIKRIATEKMLASYRLFNQKTEKIIQVVQNAKPQHRIYNYKR